MAGSMVIAEATSAQMSVAPLATLEQVSPAGLEIPESVSSDVVVDTSTGSAARLHTLPSGMAV